MAAKRVSQVSKDFGRCFSVLTVGGHRWGFGSPDKDGVRSVEFDRKREGNGILLGSVSLVGLGYMTRSPKIEIGQQFGVKFPDRPPATCVLISDTVTGIVVSGQVAGY